MKIKVITGYRKDQAYSIDAGEAHKAYYLFNNPDTRTTFKDGLAIKGSDIEVIEPDYHGTLGWNPTYTLTSEDFNEIRDKGLDKKLRAVMSKASDLAKIASPQDLNLTLSEVLKKYPQLDKPAQDNEGIMKRLGEMPHTI